jgi:hypothetical protein
MLIVLLLAMDKLLLLLFELPFPWCSRWEFEFCDFLFCFSEYVCMILSQVAPVSSHVAGPSSQPVGDESVLIQQLRSRISRMEKDLMTIHAGVAVAKKKGEIGTKIEMYVQDELITAIKSLHCE